MFIILAAYVLATNAYADTRGSRDRESGGRTTEPEVTPPTQAPKPTPPSPSGGITSQTTGSVNTGGNTGGQVTTGDEHVEVFEINIGPTNSPPPSQDEDGEGPLTPPSPCEGDGRARTTCPTDNSRTR